MKDAQLPHAGAYRTFPDEPEAYRDVAWGKTLPMVQDFRS